MMENKITRIDKRMEEAMKYIRDERLKKGLKKISDRKITELIIRHRHWNRIRDNIINLEGEKTNDEE